MTVMWMVLWGLGCGNPAYPPTQPLELEFRACVVDEDCTIVELGCCDECNGGFAVSATLGEEEAVLDEYGEGACGGTDCTLLGCNPLVPRCSNGLCIVDRSAREVGP